MKTSGTYERIGVEPRYMGISPIFAIPKLLERLGLSKEDIDVFEVSSIRMEALICSLSSNLSRSTKPLHRNSRTALKSWKFPWIRSTLSKNMTCLIQREPYILILNQGRFYLTDPSSRHECVFFICLPHWVLTSLQLVFVKWLLVSRNSVGVMVNSSAPVCA